MLRFARLLAVAALAVAAGAYAQASSAPAPKEPARVAATQPVAPADAQHEEVEVRVFNRTVTVFRAPFLGFSPRERAVRAEAAIRDLLAAAEGEEVSAKAIPQGHAILVGDKLAFLITPEDADSLRNEAPEKSAERAVQALKLVLDETRESRTLDAILRDLASAGIATAILLTAIWVVRRVRLVIAGAIASVAGRHAGRIRIGGKEIVRREHIFSSARALTSFVFWAVLLILAYQWLGFVLAQFPYTRPWGEGLQGFMLGILRDLAVSIVGALPSLFVVALIFVFAGVLVRVVYRLVEPFSTGEARSTWLDRDTARPTRNLISIGIWVFAIAMAYPYLPGSQSDAFKGLSVLIGLMVSIGSTSLVGQAASGLILMYTRTIRPGEYVRVGEHEGTVMELGMFTTRIRTGLGEELTVSNTLIAGSVTKNYSRIVQGHGFVLDTTVTIGYDTPWRQVEAMLIEAARRTEGVLAEPVPMVFQTGLSDFYPEYRLVCQAVPSEPRPRAMVLSNLHANIQDVFNEYGVQIMSPHYLGDPAEAKIVPASRLHLAPAEMPRDAKPRD